MVGLDVLCDGHPAFINCFAAKCLLTEYFALLPPNEVVVEIQETVAADEEVKEACKRLSNGADIRIALDNFVAGDDGKRSFPMPDFIKVDIRTVTPEQSAILIALHGSEHCRMLAQKVETRTLFW